MTSSQSSSRIYSDGHEVDGSWVLRIYVTDLNVERSLRVKGELHIGGVMLRLVEDLVSACMRAEKRVNLEPPLSIHCALGVGVPNIPDSKQRILATADVSNIKCPAAGHPSSGAPLL
ncbi:hypothetical protein QAD02_004235 [Eretmocerus hayati]|uniref:Uncharacterized protein n=1 Tax=Eretmocerus hayati TaxID=131215 RepID=A0ACC2NPF7_9HYME|nr:hypothetical protein QAD02_004235 [Eretmocerus hayati]